MSYCAPMYQKSIVLLALSVALSMLSASEVLALENDYELDGWVPGLSFTGGLLFTNIDARLETSDVLGPSAGPDPVQPIQPFGRGDDLQPVPFIGASFELMSPPLFADLPGRPRLFFHADVAGAFAQGDDLARNLDAGTQLSIPSLLQNSGNIPTDTLLGQGSRLTVEVQPLTYAAGLGMAFEVTLFDRMFRLKPSIEYNSYEVDLEGIVSRAIPLTTGGREPNELSDFRHILLEGQQTKRFHGIGPGFEIETDAGRVGSFVASVFLGARAYAILGGREVAVADFNDSDPDPLAQQENARWTAELSRWAYRAGVGLRFYWSPKR